MMAWDREGMEERINWWFATGARNLEALACDLSFADGDGKLGNQRGKDKSMYAYLDIAKLLKKLGIE
jgi:hypothetical protein